MEEADVLYGVTMQEEGVSKLIELRVGELEEKLGIGAGPECLTNPVRRILWDF